jgi:hypothetical protein
MNTETNLDAGQIVERLYNRGDISGEDVFAAIEASDNDWTKLIEDEGIARLLEDEIISIQTLCACLDESHWQVSDQYIDSNGQRVTVETLTAFGLTAYRWQTPNAVSDAFDSLEACLEDYGEPLERWSALPPELNVASDEWTPELHQLWHNPRAWQSVQTVTDNLRQVDCLVEQAQTADGRTFYRWVDVNRERYSPRCFHSLREAAIDLQLYLTEEVNHQHHRDN